MDLTFGEQVKIILSRKSMTIKELAETIEERTGKKMSRQNLTQRLGRDNFQEQDMRMIARILGCPFYLNILNDSIPTEKNSDNNTIEEKIEKPTLAIEVEEKKMEEIENPEIEREITVGELMDIHESLDAAISQKFEKEESDAEKVMSAKVSEIVMAEAVDVATETTEAAMNEEIKELPVEELLAEVDAIEREGQERKREKELRGQKEAAEEHGKKSRSWKSYLHFGKKKNVEEIHYEEPKEESVTDEEPAADETELRQDESLNIETEVSSKDNLTQSECAAQEEGMLQEEGPVEEDEDDTIYLEDDEDLDGDGMVDIDNNDEDLEVGDINPYTGHEYETNSVRMHPKRIGYVQVYDRTEHKWTDMTEWAFLGYQERKKTLLGKDYEPPVYLD